MVIPASIGDGRAARWAVVAAELCALGSTARDLIDAIAAAGESARRRVPGARPEPRGGAS